MRDRCYVSPFYETVIYGDWGRRMNSAADSMRMEAARSGLIPFLRDPGYDSYRSAGWFQDLLQRTGVG